MRGRSIDNDFVAEFVQECAALNKISPEEICDEALFRIEEINKQLKLRAKLTDVLSFFKYKRKIEPQKFSPISFSNISKPASDYILRIIKNSESISPKELAEKFSKYDDSYKKELIFTLKQMLETAVLSKNSDGNFILGKNLIDFNEKKLR